MHNAISQAENGSVKPAHMQITEQQNLVELQFGLLYLTDCSKH